MSQTTQNKLEEIAEIIGKDKTPQAFGCFIDYELNKVRYCATGGLAHSLGGGNMRILCATFYPKLSFNYIAKKLGITMEERRQHYQCPKCHHVRYLFQLIAHLNDYHLLSKSEIARILPLATQTEKPRTHYTFTEDCSIIKNTFFK